MISYILQGASAWGGHGRKGQAGAFLLAFTGLLAACGGGGGGGGGAPPPPPPPVTLSSIAITPLKPTVAPGATLKFTAIGKYSDSTTKDLTLSVNWASTNSAVATIGPSTGSATAIGKGTTTISGAYAGGPAITSVILTVSQTVYAYATNFDASPGTVSQYVIGVLGDLSPLPAATVAAGTNPFSVSVEPTGQYVYVANYNADTVSQYTIGAGGALTPVGSGSVATGSHPNGVTINPAPANKFAYVANFGGDTVSQYNIGTTGALAPMSSATVPTGHFPASIVISPNGKYAYVANFACSGPGCAATQGSISQYTVGADGALTPMSPATVNTGGATGRPNSLIVDPGSSHLYVANAGDNNVSVFSIGASGALTVVGSPVPTGGIFPFSVTVDPSGRFVYVANTGSASGPAVPGTISQYSIDPTTGALSSIAANVNAGSGVSSVTVDPTGAFAYATNRGESTLSQYTIDPTTGALTPMTPATVPAGLHPTSIATGY